MLSARLKIFEKLDYRITRTEDGQNNHFRREQNGKHIEANNR
jgi:hypothetical protein